MAQRNGRNAESRSSRCAFNSLDASSGFSKYSQTTVHHAGFCAASVRFVEDGKNVTHVDPEVWGGLGKFLRVDRDAHESPTALESDPG